MQENLTSKPFILALHDDHAHATRELGDEETQRVAGGDGICMTEMCLLVTPGCESAEWVCDD
jgi:hypothetical protein